MRTKQNCKINVGLKVLNKRTDGYHNLISVFVPVRLYDTLSYRLTSSKIVVKTKAIPQEKNIVYKTAKLMHEKYDVKKGIHIGIRKRIPIAAGLGGGSADAAMTIKMLNKMWGLNLSFEEMSKLGEEIGSDVPFFVQNELAVVRGRGEDVEKLDSSIKLFLLLIKPDFGFQTKAIFANLPRETGNENNIDHVITGFRESDLEKIVANLKNDLETGILCDSSKAKVIIKIKNDLIKVGALNSSMSGSGSCVYGIFKHDNELKTARKLLFKEGYQKRQVYMISSI
ncbi:MAG: 4-(cytidine 5'-diphospho)-2-C-methyl-D-erythritol kinase [Bacilli bacterium]